ncbi:hypothetical protein N9M10_02065 [Hellea sp.]|nr:hypothetical protein [Hellea sp.]
MEEDFTLKSKGFFNPDYMNALYDYGRGKAVEELSDKPDDIQSRD